MDPHSPNKLFATKYCFLILGDEFLFLNHFFILRFFFVLLCYFVIINFTKTMLLLSFFFNYYFFSWKLLLFFHIPGCSGMFRHVPDWPFLSLTGIVIQQSYVKMPGGRLRETENKRVCQISGLKSGSGLLCRVRWLTREFLNQYLTERQDD